MLFQRAVSTLVHGGAMVTTYAPHSKDSLIGTSSFEALGKSMVDVIVVL